LLALQYRTFVELALATLGLLGVSILALLLFASRLAWRIRRLGRETGHAIDARGRLRHVRIAAEAHSADELGELSRSISELLGRLQRHTQFLRNLPRTLRHEISNPLNTIATALHNLAVETHDRERYLASAERGLTRLERILGALTEAANLDEALQQETREPLDLAALLASYLESFALLHPGLLGVRELPLDGAMLDGNAQRIEQLLDKLFDNAAGFTPPDGRVDVTLRRVGGQLVLEIANDGPPPPAAEQAALFEAMVSRRGGVPLEAPHLGIGLYVARRIVEEHGGSIRLDARPDGGGAVVTLRLPARDHA
jgi:signal transduction histidine kinase